MTCIEGCNSEETVFSFTTTYGTFNISQFDTEGDYFAFDTDETEANVKYDSRGNIYISGHNWVRRNFSITTLCSDEAAALDTAWRENGPVLSCGTATLIRNCCSNYTWPSVRLASVQAPSSGTDIGTYVFSFEGIVS